MANNNLDPVQLAKRVSSQLVKWSVGQKNKRKSLQWKIDSLEWKFAKQNFGDCCKMIIDGAEVALKVEEELSNMEASVEGGEGDEGLRMKVELVRRKVERYYRLIHLFSTYPQEFADCQVEGRVGEGQSFCTAKNWSHCEKRLKYKPAQIIPHFGR